MTVGREEQGARVAWEGRHPIKADVFFVHGLGGHPTSTWSVDLGKKKDLSLRRLFSSNKSPAVSSTSIFWPRDLLPQDVPDVRIISYGYDCEILKFFAATNSNNLFWHARNMLAEIQRLRSEHPERPAVFVCHSLGGILVKEALRLSRAATYQANLQGLYKSTYGIVFLGTPHRGSTWAPWGGLIGNITKLALQSPNTALLRSLEVDSMALQMIAEEFSNMIRDDVAVYSFREERGMGGIYGLDGKIVDDFSSVIGDAAEGKEGIDANHHDMCKFASRDDAGYRKVAAEIKRFVSAATQRGPSPSSNSNPSNQEATDSLELWPDFISRTVQLKILRDKIYNHVNFGDTNSVPTIDMPTVDLAALEAVSDYQPPQKLHLGSSFFELLDLLHLLPGQSNASLLRVETMPLSDLITDERSYYSRISQEGLLKLICQHFHSISEDDGALSVLTKIGTFKFRFGRAAELDHGVSVTFTSRERSSTRIAPPDQDFASVQQSARGLIRVRKNLNADYFGQARGTPGLPVEPPEWKPLNIKLALAQLDLDHANCLRFVSASDYIELKECLGIASMILELSFEILEQRSNDIDDYTKEGLGTIKILSGKSLSAGPKSLSISVAVSKWVIGGVARMVLSQRQVEPEREGQPHGPRTKTEAQTPQMDLGEFVQSRYAPRDSSTTDPTITSSVRGMNFPSALPIGCYQSFTNNSDHAEEGIDEEAVAGRLLKEAVSELDNLEGLIRTSPTSDSLRARIRELGQTQLELLATLVAIQIVYKTNASLILRTSVRSPERWLQLLSSTSTDVDILIG